MKAWKGRLTTLPTVYTQATTSLYKGREEKKRNTGKI